MNILAFPLPMEKARLKVVLFFLWGSVTYILKYGRLPPISSNKSFFDGLLMTTIRATALKTRVSTYCLRMEFLTQNKKKMRWIILVMYVCMLLMTELYTKITEQFCVKMRKDFIFNCIIHYFKKRFTLFSIKYLSESVWNRLKMAEIFQGSDNIKMKALIFIEKLRRRFVSDKKNISLDFLLVVKQ